MAFSLCSCLFSLHNTKNVAKAQAISLATRYMQMQVVDVEQARGRKCKVLLVQAGSLAGQGENASNLKLLPATWGGPE